MLSVIGVWIAGFCAVYYVMLAWLASQRGAGYGRITRFMIAYSSLAAFVELVHSVARQQILPGNVAIYSEWMQPFFILALAVALLACTTEKMMLSPRHWWVVGLLTAWAAVMSLLLLLGGEGFINGAGIRLLRGGWIATALAVIWFSWEGARKERFTERRGRVISWLGGAALALLADLASLGGWDLLGSLMRVAALTIIGYQVFIHSTDDFRWTLRRGAAFVINGLLGVLGCSLILAMPDQSMALLGVSSSANRVLVRAAALAFLAIPLISIFSGFVNKSFLGLGFDQGAIVRSYSAQVNSILSLTQLARKVTELIGEIFKAEPGGLFLVGLDESKSNSVLTPISPSASTASPSTPAIVFAHGSPFYRRITSLRLPIGRHDVEYIDEFRELPEPERTWLTSQAYDLYVPIFGKDEAWLGLLALRAKRSGERYYPQDIDLLSLLADQTTSALMNARLLDDTLRLNEELKQVQAEMIASHKKLHEMDEMKTAFIGVLTHEMRTPLANIQFSLQVLQMYFKNQMNAEQIQQFKELDQAARQARGMIDNLVNFASFLNQRVELKLTEFDFREALKDVLLPLKPVVDSRGLKMQVNLVGDRYIVYGDRNLLKEAVQQLLNNAIKFTSRGSIRVICWNTSDGICLDVEDTGIGIASDNLDHLWVSFTQLNSDSVKRGVEGLGLGLALVKYIITAHGGQVWVESVLGEGSTFGFAIPVTGPDYPLPAGAAERPDRLYIPGSA